MPIGLGREHFPSRGYQCRCRAFRAVVFLISFPKASRPRLSRFRRSFSNWARICNPGIYLRRKRILPLCSNPVRRRIPLHLRRAATRSRRRSSNSHRISNPGTYRLLSKTSRRFSRTSRTKRAAQGHHHHHGGGAGKPIRLVRSLRNWARHCNPAIFLPLSRPTARCSRPSSKLSKTASCSLWNRPSPVRIAFL